MRWLIATLFVGLAACGPIGVTEPYDGPDLLTDSPTLAQRAEWVLFRHDDGRPKRLDRWEQPIRAMVFDAGIYYSAVQDHLGLIGELTGLAVEVAPGFAVPGNEAVPPPPGYNLAVRFGVPSRVHVYAEKSAQIMQVPEPPIGYYSCFGYVEPASILASEATIIIRSDLAPESIYQCITQELTQFLGAPGDLDGRTDTAFTSDGGSQTLTIDDQRIVRILYDRRLTRGMTAIQARSSIGEIVAENGW